MSTAQFLEYLQTHPATHALGAGLASICAARQASHLVPAMVRVQAEHERVSHSA